MVDPLRFTGRKALSFNGNSNTVVNFKKDYQKDPWTSTIARATRVIKAAIGKTLFVSWERQIFHPKNSYVGSCTVPGD